jgi:hypothetical protein
VGEVRDRPFASVFRVQGIGLSRVSFVHQCGLVAAGWGRRLGGWAAEANSNRCFSTAIERRCGSLPHCCEGLTTIIVVP